jgi:hypothetical protein
LPTVRIVQPRNTLFEKIEWFSNMPRGGKRPGSGRKKGGTNKITADVREAIMEAFSILGGAEYLRKVATEDPKAFCPGQAHPRQSRER